MSQLPEFLLEMLACPRCRGALQVEEAALRCDVCHLRYRVDDQGVPDFLIEDAAAVDEGSATQ